MKFNSYEAQSVIAPTSSMSSHFQLDSSSVIKTAPPGHHHRQQQQPEFSPKHEPIDLAPLTQSSLQDLSKMQPTMEHYYIPAGYNRAYDYMSVAAAAYPMSSAVFSPSVTAAAASSSNQHQQQQQQEWRNAMDPYVYQRSNSSNSSGLHYQHQQQQQNAVDSSTISLVQQQHDQRLYKALNGEMLLSPVDSGIGADLSIIDPAAFVTSASSAVIQSHLSSLAQQQQQSQQQQHGTVIATHSATAATSELLHNGNGNGGSIVINERRANSIFSHRESSSPVHIRKLQNSLGFQYVLEAPISTSIRREDDRMTYVNKGQFYTISLDYLLDVKPLKSSTVRSVIAVVFREDKSYDEEIKTWQLWHKRQHTAKQRILEVDAKNSSGVVGQIEEVAHNAVQFCWNPSEQSGAKVSIAVQCLSTDFSTQKGVKGLPLHVQIDTFDEADDSKTPFHRGYCQIKVFCDKGAERKLRDEDKRANRRKNAAGGGVPGQGVRKKSDGEFHEMCDRSEFYHMSDLDRPAALFIPSDDFDTRFLDTTSIASYETLSEIEPLTKRPRTSERIMIYVREEDEEIYTPLHIIPPTVMGLSHAIGDKYNLDESRISGLYKQCTKGVTVKIDDDMLRHYTNQDTFLIDIKRLVDDTSYYAVTLVELMISSSATAAAGLGVVPTNSSIYHPVPSQQLHHSHHQNNNHIHS